MNQRVRSLDPVTSHIAAVRVDEFALSHQEQIVSCLIEFGPMGAEAMEYKLFIPSYAIRKRLPELERMCEVKQTGRLLKTRSGRMEREWEKAWS